jgi:polysaccharide biosynthesis/export protein
MPQGALMRTMILRLAVAMFAGLLACAQGHAAGQILTTNDVLQISVVNQSDLNATARVEPDGTISLPYAGKIQAAGMTKDALSKAIAQMLVKKNILKNPQVLVETTAFGTQVSVLGAVGTPGSFTLDRPSDIIQVLARAGGIKEEAGAATIVLHSNGTVRRIDAKALFEGDSSAGAILVHNNDKIYVEQGAIFYLYGYVNKPGQYALSRNEMTVQQAIAAGGGIAPLGSDWRIRIRRRVNGVIEERSAQLEDLISANDTIVVNERIF